VAEGLYLYCVAPAGHDPPAALDGLDDAQVTALEHDGLTVWMSALGRPPEASVEGVRRHHAVVDAAISETVTPVPFRFGQWAATEAAVRASIAPKADAWLRSLEAWAGALEFGVRVLDPARDRPARTVHAAAMSSGREYLEALARVRTEERDGVRHAEEVAALVRGRVGGLTIADTVAPLATAHGIASIAHLVRRGSFAEYHERMAAVRAEQSGLRFVLSGPWPPYSFAA
jgi:hypothetical protein